MFIITNNTNSQLRRSSWANTSIQFISQKTQGQPPLKKKWHLYDTLQRLYINIYRPNLQENWNMNNRKLQKAIKRHDLRSFPAPHTYDNCHTFNWKETYNLNMHGNSKRHDTVQTIILLTEILASLLCTYNLRQNVRSLLTMKLIWLIL